MPLMKNTMLMIILILTLINCAKKSDDQNTELNKAWVETPKTIDWGTLIDTDKPNVMVIGDSISIGLTGPLKDLLINSYDVFHPLDNCRNSTYTLMNIDKWMNERANIDVVIWNNGLWDFVNEIEITKGQPVEYYTTSDELYIQNLIKIAQKLKQYSKRVVFFTTTEIPQGQGTFKLGKEIQMNQIAAETLQKYGVEILDLYTYTMSIPNARINHFDVHFKPSSNQLIAEFINQSLGLQ